MAQSTAIFAPRLSKIKGITRRFEGLNGERTMKNGFFGIASKSTIAPLDDEGEQASTQ